MIYRVLTVGATGDMQDGLYPQVTYHGLGGMEGEVLSG